MEITIFRDVTPGHGNNRFFCTKQVTDFQTTRRHISDVVVATAVSTLTHTDRDAVPGDSSDTKGSKLAC
jgi:hypothetical protein